jgi:hypothetical protein
MAPKASTGQTVVDGLKTVHADIANLLIMPDSAQHMQFLTGLMGQVQKYIQQQGTQAAGMAMQGAGGAAGQPMPGGPPGGPPGGGSGGPTGPPVQGPPPGAGGPMRGPLNAPNPDELRRVLGATGAVA